MAAAESRSTVMLAMSSALLIERVAPGGNPLPVQSSAAQRYPSITIGSLLAPIDVAPRIRMVWLRRLVAFHHLHSATLLWMARSGDNAAVLNSSA
jgi:hypothetical protein